jgi:glutathione S-transferase
MQENTRSVEVTNTLNRLEKILRSNAYLHGAQLTSLDKDAYAELQPNESQIKPENHPAVFAWYCQIGRYSEARRAQWAQVDAPAQEAAKKDEVDVDDLFGDDDGDAAAV